MRPVPTRYILSTSVELSDANKRQLSDILELKDTSDILGSNDLNNLLGLNPQIERAHYKLWFSSTPVLQKILHNAEVIRTNFEFKRVQQRVPRFVRSQAYNLAAKQLEQDRILILSGNPGVGKTTIAEFLLYEKFSEGFEPIIARNGLQEALALYKEGARQVFYYDDFLGETFLGEGGSVLSRNEDRTISDFIDIIADDEEKFLILTTRQHILSEAFEKSERLRHSAMADFRYIVEIGSYTEDERARLLYNHAYFNRLPSPYVDKLLDEKFYLRIIQHPRFSPRIIEWLTTPRRIKNCAVRFYQMFILSLLYNSSEIWQFAYDKQISEAARSALLALHSLEGRSSLQELNSVFDYLHDERSNRYRFQKEPNDFLSAIRALSESFITVQGDFVQFIDPSVRDLMNAILLRVPENCLDILGAAQSMIQVETTWNLAKRENGKNIEALMRSKPDAWTDGIVKALESSIPQRSNYLRGTIENWLLVLIDISSKMNSITLMAKIPTTVERVIAAWRGVPPDLRAAIDALRLLSPSQFHDGLVPQHLWLKMRSALMAQTQYEFEPSDVAILLGIETNHPLTLADLKALRMVASGWPVRMSDRIRECRSKTELHALAGNLRSVEQAIGADLRGPISAVEVELRMFVEPHESVRHHRAGGNYFLDYMVHTTPIDELFDSLRYSEI